MGADGEFLLDYARAERIGFGEAVYCAGKSPVQIAAILEQAAGRGASLLLTRLDEARFAALPTALKVQLDYDAQSATAVLGEPAPARPGKPVAVVTAGTSDVPVAREALRTLHFNGIVAEMINDVGVAGLWRLLARVEALRAAPVVIVAAGMDAALPSVVAGLVPGCVIAVPTSVGYGVAAGGRAALDAILASCAPGIATVNIDNGYGAACAALRVLGARERADTMP
jgi:pyridinium-3,5-biscarboxylic acid mononucleotide synthase